VSGEFELIARIAAALPCRRKDVLLGPGDDAALLRPPRAGQLVQTVDTCIEGVHFPPGLDPQDIGWRCLAVNLSDLAAMGAEPAWALLSLSLPAADETWLRGFCAGLYGLAERHGVALVGGDTVRGPRVISVTALGFVDGSKALRRSGARAGDLLYVSGWPGEAAAGLEALRGGAGRDAPDPLVRRYLYAEPRVALGRALQGRASAAMDVSDGLLGDLGKLCAASGVGARLDLERLPVSAELLRRHATAERERFVLFGGDDYELLFTLPAAEAKRLEAAWSGAPPVHCIGEIEGGGGVRCTRNGIPASVTGGGYDHFA
jgi:thiamine-monophosphate kinase